MLGLFINTLTLTKHTYYIYILYIYYIISHRFTELASGCVLPLAQVYGMKPFSSLGGGGEVERTQTGFPLMLNWNKEIVFFLKFELTIFNNQRINIRVFLEFLAIFMKVLLYFYLKSLIFFTWKSGKTGTKNTLLSQSRASLVFSRNSDSDSEKDRLLCWNNYSMVQGDQRIFIYTEGSAAPFVFNKSVFCLRKPEAVRKMTTELLAAVLRNIILC